MTMTTDDRCAAAHVEDPSDCDGPAAAVRIVDRDNADVLGCPRHGAVTLASIDGGRVYQGPDCRDGDAIEVYRRAQILPPLAFGALYDHAMARHKTLRGLAHWAMRQQAAGQGVSGTKK
jgi:hypothetical protein